MLHYPGPTRKLGPAVHFWSTCFEEKQVFHTSKSCDLQLGEYSSNPGVQMSDTPCCLDRSSPSARRQAWIASLFGTTEDFVEVKNAFEGTAGLTEVSLPSWFQYKGTSDRSHCADQPQFGTIKNILVTTSESKSLTWLLYKQPVS